MSPLFKKKEKESREVQKISEQPVIEKPKEGICAKCGSTNLSFFDDGTGKCNNCDRVFNWKEKLSAQQQAPEPVQQAPQPQQNITRFSEAPPTPQESQKNSSSVSSSVSPPQPAIPSANESQVIETQKGTEPQEFIQSQQQSLPAQTPPVQSISTPIITTEGAFRRSEKIEETLMDLRNRVERINDTSERYRLEINEIKESITRIESKLHELTALYDAISAQFNPFIDVEFKKESAISEVSTPEKLGEELSEAMILDKVACPKCGELIPEDAKVCPKCGAPMQISEDSQSGKPENPPSTPVESPSYPSSAVGQTLPQMNVMPGTQQKFGPLLQKIGSDYRSSLLAMRWIEYLLERVDLADLPQVLDYYRKINWISNEVKADILWKIKGIKIEKKIQKSDAKDGWRLSINDHLKTLMFIEMLRGTQIDKQTLEDLEREMERLKKNNLEDFYGL